MDFAYDAETIFGENNFIFDFLGYGLVIKSLGDSVHIWEGWGENKTSQNEYNLFPTKLRWISHLISKG
jgi:hypothetical protein